MGVAQCELGVVLRGRLRAEGFGEGRYGLRTSATKMGGRERRVERALGRDWRGIWREEEEAWLSRAGRHKSRCVNNK